jgi:Zn-dependent protease with chaperone function
MSAVDAIFFDGKISLPHKVRVSGAAEALAIEGNGWRREVSRSEIRVTTRIAGTHRTLLFPDGAQLQVRDNDAVDAWFPRRNRLEALVDRLERHATAVAAALVITIASTAWVIFYGLPIAAAHVARYIPDTVTERMGEETQQMLPRFGFKPSQLPQGREETLQAEFKSYVEGLPHADHYRLRLFHAPEGFGANAFALPGGTIVFTDQLIELFKDDEQFLAVVAHEIGHEEHRHLLRSVLQSSGIVLITALVTGDVGSAGAIVIAIPTFLLHSHYSRSFESEADEFAFASLAAHDISPARFAEVMRLLQKAHPASESGTAYLSTHPPTYDRIARAREAAAAFDAAHPEADSADDN